MTNHFECFVPLYWRPCFPLTGAFPLNGHHMVIPRSKLYRRKRPDLSMFPVKLWNQDPASGSDDQIPSIPVTCIHRMSLSDMDAVSGTFPDNGSDSFSLSQYSITFARSLPGSVPNVTFFN